MEKWIVLLEQFTRPHRDGENTLILPEHFHEAVSAILDHNGNAYRISERDKGNGKKRVIEAPSDSAELPLKQVQKIIHKTLSPLDNGKSSHGFRPLQSAHTGIVKMTSAIEKGENPDGIKSMYSLDVRNFFPSVTQEMIRKEVGMLLSRLLVTHKKWPKLSEDDLESLIDVMTQVCTYEWRLPQGAPSSPVLANIVANRIDGRIRHALEDKMDLAKKAVYGRYADDLVLMSGTNLSNAQRKTIRQIVSDFWLTIAHEKTLYEEGKGSYNVWGVEVVNGKDEKDKPHLTFKISPERDREYAATILEISDQIQSWKLADSKELQTALNRISWILWFSYHISVLWDGERIIPKIQSGKKAYFLSDRCEHAWRIFLMNHESLLHPNCKNWFTGTEFLGRGNTYAKYKAKVRKWRYGGGRDFTGFKW